MKRVMGVLLLAGALVFVGHAFAKEGKAESKPTTLKGEVVDTGCYTAHGASGEKHKECGAKCVANGMPMGLLTKDGKVYLLTPDHDSADAYNKLKDLIDAQVEVTGIVSERGGIKAIDVTDVKPAATAANTK